MRKERTPEQNRAREQYKRTAILSLVALIVLGGYIGLRHSMWEPKFTATCMTQMGVLHHTEITRYGLEGGTVQLYIQGDWMYPTMTVSNGQCVIVKTPEK